MAVSQGSTLQQPLGQTQPQQPPSPGPSAPTATTSQAPTSQDTQGRALGEQAPSTDQDFRHALEQQIAQAIQPVLADFREQLAQEMSPQTSGTPGPSQDGQQSGRSASPASGTPTGGPQAAPQQPRAQVTPSATGGQQVTGQPVSPSQPQQGAPVAPGGQATSGAEQTEVPVKNIAQRPVSGALAPAMQTVEQTGAQWLQSILVAGFGALLSESTHAAVQQRAEQGLHTLLEKLFAAAPDGTTNQDMLRKSEGTLQLILRESVDAVFAEGTRTALQQGGQQTVQQSLHGDFGGALRKVQDTLKALVAALLAVLRRHQQTMFRLLLALALLALENSLAQPAKAQ
jgi:hypothetical protein